MREKFHKVWKDHRGWMYVVRPHSGGYRGCYRKKGEQDWKAVHTLPAEEERKAEKELERYAVNHGMKRVI